MILFILVKDIPRRVKNLFIFCGEFFWLVYAIHVEIDTEYIKTNLKIFCSQKKII
jgi:hypothetical protein